MEVLQVTTSLEKARRLREIIAANKRATYDPVEDIYVFSENGVQRKLRVEKVEGKYSYQVTVE